MASLAQANREDRRPEAEEIAQLPDVGEAEAVLIELASMFSGMTSPSSRETDEPASGQSAHATLRWRMKRITSAPRRRRNPT